MKDVLADEIFSYWESLRHGRLVPKRSEVDPRMLQKSLNYTFILELNASGIARFRLAGSKVSDCMGMEMRGMPAHSLIVPENRDYFSTALDASFNTPEILDLNLSHKARLILLPMSDEANQTTRMLGCLIANTTHPDFPTRLAVKSLSRTRIVASKPTYKKPVLEMAEDQADFIAAQTKKATQSRPPYLRIVK